MANELGSEWDPANANFGESMDGGTNGMIPGLCFLAAFGTLGIGAFITTGMIAPGAYAGIGSVAGSNLYYGMNQTNADLIEATMAAWETEGTPITAEVSTLIQQSAFAKPFETSSWSQVGSAITLAAYNVVQNQNHFINIGGLGFQPLPGGDPSIPGFPGFLEGAHVVHGWHRVCYMVRTVDDDYDMVCVMEE